MKDFRLDSLKSLLRPRKMAPLMLLRVCGACLILTLVRVLSTRMAAARISLKGEVLLVRNVDVLETFGECVHIQKSSLNENFTTTSQKPKTQMT